MIPSAVATSSMRLPGTSRRKLSPIQVNCTRSRWLRPMVRCGQHSLEIFCIGVFLAFAGHFVLAEVSGGPWMHLMVSVSGIVIMSAAAWVFSWYKAVAGKGGKRAKSADADFAGGGA